jgi:cephalosporin hydroxylase
MNYEIEKYLKKSYKKVQGWYSQSTLELIAELSVVQNKQGIEGSFCEIGVHHGRAFILLCLLAKENEKCIAIDLFDNQQENIDHSGHGNEKMFRRNLLLNECDLSKIEILSENSFNIKTETLLGLSELKYRIFSVDGGHTKETVVNDLRLAESVLTKGGIIIVDDFFDEKWPGVSEGTLSYLSNYESTLKPFAIFDGKILFTNDYASKEKYLEKLSTLVPKFIVKESEFLSEKCLILYTSSNKIRNRLRQTKLWQKLRNSKLRKFYDRLNFNL